MARVYGLISLLSLLLAAWLAVSPAPGSVAFGPVLGAPEPGPTPAACSGLVVSGSRSGCLVLTEIVCRASTETITAQALLGGATPVALQVRPDQVTVVVTSGGDRTSYLGPGPRSFDPSQGARLDDEYGDLRGPDHVHLTGWVSCGF